MVEQSIDVGNDCQEDLREDVEPKHDVCSATRERGRRRKKYEAWGNARRQSTRKSIPTYRRINRQPTLPSLYSPGPFSSTVLALRPKRDSRLGCNVIWKRRLMTWHILLQNHQEQSHLPPPLLSNAHRSRGSKLSVV